MEILFLKSPGLYLILFSKEGGYVHLYVGMTNEKLKTRIKTFIRHQIQQENYSSDQTIEKRIFTNIFLKKQNNSCIKILLAIYHQRIDRDHHLQ